jgi:DNA modification methylase
MAEQITQNELFSSADLTASPVECLGMTFPSDSDRRAYFLDKLREKLQDPDFRAIEGFPIGNDEDILALSDPPYYTACPNPFLEEFIQHYGKPFDAEVNGYHREPFAADVSEGKNDPIYNAHSYHTKVPHKAIMRYILHYTEPGDIVFDGFCGTGMTGVAAQLCGDKATVESLGYRVEKDGTILDEDRQPFSKLGARRAILNDLSPAATFIAYNYNTPVDVAAFEREARRILEDVEAECGWMYETLHQGNTKGRINYTVWSDVFTCAECAGEIVFWDVAVDKVAGQVRDEFECPHCNALMTKRNMERAWVTRYDKAINQTIRQAKQVPVLINYTYGKKRHEKTPDDFDLALIEKIEGLDIPYWFPTDRMMEGGETRRNDPIGITHVHHFYTKRNLALFAAVWSKCSRYTQWIVTACIQRGSKQHQIAITRIGGEKAGVGGATAGHRRGTLYIPSNQVEMSVFNLLEDRYRSIVKSLRNFQAKTYVSNGSSTSLKFLTSNSLDYLFFDPPFGANIMYSELSFGWESWLKLFTNNKSEAIEDKTKGKSLDDYRHLMTQCFCEAYRILKPGRWMTVEFSNTQASVWNSIQTALQEAGFIVANVSALDKGRGGLNAIVGLTAVKQDLVISAYKPTVALEQSLDRRDENTVWEFVRVHLSNLPHVKTKQGNLEFIAERDPRILYDRMISYFFQRGIPIPLSSADFQVGLTERFSERDGMVFLPDQLAAYDKKRIQTASAPQLELFVYDEKSSIDWLHHFLKQRPSTYQDIQPEFLKQLSASWRKYEIRPELQTLLERNFLRYEGLGEVPSQIHSYLSSNYRDLRNLEKHDPRLVAKAKERWYVPDPNKASDLEQMRLKELLKQFETYRQASTKKIKEFRIEAIRAGFKQAWADKDYRTIVDVAKKLPDSVIQEDEKLLLYHDNALNRLDED